MPQSGDSQARVLTNGAKQSTSASQAKAFGSGATFSQSGELQARILTTGAKQLTSSEQAKAFGSGATFSQSGLSQAKIFSGAGLKPQNGFRFWGCDVAVRGVASQSHGGRREAVKFRIACKGLQGHQTTKGQRSQKFHISTQIY